VPTVAHWLPCLHQWMIMKIILILIVLIENYLLYRFAFSRGVKREQQARLRRLNALQKVLYTSE
jgi:hypothetical protein